MASVWRQRAREEPAGQLPEASGFFVDKSALPVESLLEHGGGGDAEVPVVQATLGNLASSESGVGQHGSEGARPAALAGLWRKRARERPQAQASAGQLLESSGFFVEQSALPIESLLEHGDGDGDGDDPVATATLGLGLGVSLLDGSESGAALQHGLCAVMFAADDSALVGVCLLASGKVVRLSGFVTQSMECSDDCCKRTTVRLRFQLESDERVPIKTVLAKSELSLGDYWNWTSALCSFSTDSVVCDADRRARIIAQHFRSLATYENPMGTSSGVICVGSMHLLLERCANDHDASACLWPPEGEAALGALCVRNTSCAWHEDMQWVGRGLESSVRRSSSTGDDALSLIGTRK